MTLVSVQCLPRISRPRRICQDRQGNHVHPPDRGYVRCDELLDFPMCAQAPVLKSGITPAGLVHAMPPEERTGGQLIVAALENAGVGYCFGVPGESFLGVLDALYDSSIKVVSTRHEGGGSFMAAGYA